jgi:diguanylate cyclase (GGDEF)-like protein
LVGDSVIADIARLVRQNIRMSDRLMRWGGEEFVVVLPGSNHEGAMARAEAIRAVIATHEFKAGEFLFRKSVSIGVVQWDGKESNDMLCYLPVQIMHCYSRNNRVETVLF